MVDTKKGAIELRYPTDPRPIFVDTKSLIFTSPAIVIFPRPSTVLTREAVLT